jgi:drug/metabolite transporter (DMT)-like permease
MLAAAATGSQVGATIVATRYVIDQTDPLTLTLLRYAIGGTVLIPFALAARRVPWRPRDLLPIAALGVVQFGVVVALLNYALQTISAGRASLIFATFPLLTMVFAAALRHERLTVMKSAGVGLTVLGVGLTLGEKAFLPGSADWLGEAAVLLSAASGALCSVLYRPSLQRYDPLPVGALAMLASVGFLAVLAAPQGFFSEPPGLTGGGRAAGGRRWPSSACRAASSTGSGCGRCVTARRRAWRPFWRWGRQRHSCWAPPSWENRSRCCRCSAWRPWRLACGSPTASSSAPQAFGRKMPGRGHKCVARLGQQQVLAANPGRTLDDDVNRGGGSRDRLGCRLPP